ncbi:MAG: VWA domain-containing protein [Gordonia sp. (in: high G+C Gram-positive bacteria)]
MTSTLGRGANAALPTGTVTIAVSGTPVDVVAFQLDASRRVRSDDDFVFYNNPRSPEGAVVLTSASTLTVEPAALPATIDRIAVGVSVDAPATLGAARIETTVTAGGQTIVAPAEGLTVERAAVLVEVYRRGGSWKVRSESAGWEAGFAALVRAHGVIVDDEPPAPTPAAPPPPAPLPPAPPAPTPQRPGIRMVKGEEKLSLEKRQTLNLRKEQVHRVLLTKGAAGATARVILVIDKTLSMSRLYKKQTVHRVVERIVPVATQLDSDGNLEAYLYGKRYAKLPDVTVAGADEWIATYVHLRGKHGPPLGPQIDYDREIGGINEELPIMSAVLGDAGDRQPVLVLFFTDGGFHSKVPQIRQFIGDAAARPVFWQFIGLGHNNFGVLTQLDTLAGRIVDNAGFFPIADIDAIDDGALYELLLSEFPDWLREVVRLGIVDARYAG